MCVHMCACMHMYVQMQTGGTKSFGVEGMKISALSSSETRANCLKYLEGKAMDEAFTLFRVVP